MNWQMSIMSGPRWPHTWVPVIFKVIETCKQVLYTPKKKEERQAVFFRARHFDIEMLQYNKISFLNNLETVNVPLFGNK